MTRREEDAAAVRRLALHGMSQDAWKRFNDEGYRHYDVVEAGFKYNMTDMQAALGIHQLKRVEASWRRRQEIWRRYDDALRGLPLTLPAAPAPGTRHALHLYTVLLDEAQARLTRDAFLDAMTAHNIGVGVHYVSIPAHSVLPATLRLETRGLSRRDAHREDDRQPAALGGAERRRRRGRGERGAADPVMSGAANAWPGPRGR